ncbi:facilitated trehalose transporter Tret1-like [Anoplophora glabripennis]|uniref:facilitated trehalose transporter Tret1-like n=1 Tax=Anoplophora glabripennis TaxID=217634 RepID=UPI0008754F47|nr:facilitated trehalose transporter Tret1-like [Anoplophora glabripennis]
MWAPISYTLVCVVTVNLLATAGDVALTWTSPIYPKLYSNDSSINPLGRPITESEDGWLGSLVNIGAMVGPFPFSFIAKRFGRKVGLLSLAIPLIVSFVVFAFATNIYVFYFARILGGLAMGGGYSLLPMYIAEISEDSNRGMMSLTLNIFWAIGNFLPYAIGPFISITLFSLILACIPTAFFIIFLVVGVETPYYYAGVNKADKAEKSLMKLRCTGKEGVQTELDSIKAHLKQDDDGHFSDIIKRKELRKAFIICIILIIAEEACGSCAITFYLQPIFEAAGTTLSSDISALIVGAALLISSFVAPFVVDRVGRKLLTVVSCIGMMIALLMLGVFFYIQDSTEYSTDSIMWVPIFSLIFFIVSFNLGLGCIPWTLCSELFPNNVKHIAASSVSSVCWITSFLVTKFFNDMNDLMGRAGTFWFFSCACFAAGIFSLIYVPETKGKSFSEIQDMLKYGTQKKTVHDNQKADIILNDKLRTDKNGCENIAYLHSHE